MPDFAKALRDARKRADLTQQELAVLAGTSQPALARYESGATVPSLPTLERLLTACGLQLRIAAIPGPRDAEVTSIRSRSGRFAERLRRRRPAVLDAARKRGIGRVRVFGSVARGDADPGDLDLLVDLKPGRTLVDLAGFRRDVADLLDLPVDVATPDMLKDRLRHEVLDEALPL